MRFYLATGLISLIIAGCSSSSANNVSTGPWLLLAPPLSSSGNPGTSAPLSNWQIVGNYAHSTDCKSSMASQQMGAQAWYGPIRQSQGTPGQNNAVMILNAQCVASDDPGLAK
jgi:hypothetical protein